MNQVTAITDKILADAREKLALQEEETGRRLAEIAAASEKAARAAEEEILTRARARAQAVLERIPSQEELILRQARLSCQRELIEEAFRRALEELCALPAEEKIPLYTRMICAFQRQDASVILNREDLSQLGRRLMEHAVPLQRQKGLALRLEETPGQFAGGLILKEGKTESNCTFPVLLEGLGPQLEGEIARLLDSGAK